MPDLEQLLREKLADLAEETVTAVPLAARVRAARRRRTRSWVGAAAAAVVLIAGGTGIALHRIDVASGPSVATPSGDATNGAPSALGFRLEVWRDVVVYVPATWGWGGAPGACGVGPTVGADGHRLSGDEVLAGYVGRPIAQTADCRPASSSSRSSGSSGPASAEPLMPYVWLGADVPVGARDLGAGWVQVTRRVGGTTVTVATRDAAERRSILASAHTAASGTCAPALAEPPSTGTGGHANAGDRPSGRFEPDSMTVCAYGSSPSASGSGAPYGLLYEEQLAAGPAKQLVDAVDRAAPMGEHSCFAASGGEWALLRLADAGGTSRDYVVDLSCPSIADAAGLQHELTSADVLPWAVDGVNAVLHGSPLIDVPGRLIG